MRTLTISEFCGKRLLCMFLMRDKDGSEGYSEVRSFANMQECRRYAAFMGVAPANIRIR
jgi:hypothetical protein